MTRLFRFLFLIAFVATLNGPEVLAQATGGMTGVVTDDTGAVIPGVSLEVANQGTGQTRVVVSAADGFYTVPLLAPGQYTGHRDLARLQDRGPRRRHRARQRHRPRRCHDGGGRGPGGRDRHR